MGNPLKKLRQRAKSFFGNVDDKARDYAKRTGRQTAKTVAPYKPYIDAAVVYGISFVPVVGQLAAPIVATTGVATSYYVGATAARAKGEKGHEAKEAGRALAKKTALATGAAVLLGGISAWLTGAGSFYSAGAASSTVPAGFGSTAGTVPAGFGSTAGAVPAGFGGVSSAEAAAGASFFGFSSATGGAPAAGGGFWAGLWSGAKDLLGLGTLKSAYDVYSAFDAKKGAGAAAETPWIPGLEDVFGPVAGGGGGEGGEEPGVVERLIQSPGGKLAVIALGGAVVIVAGVAVYGRKRKAA